MALIDELIHAVERSASLTHQQAEGAIGGALKFLASRLPSPLFGELQSRLSATPDRFPDLKPGLKAASEDPSRTPLSPK